MKRIGIFWDYENCCTPARMSGYSVAGNIRRAAAALGDEISIFKAYVDVHLESSSKTGQQTELQASGVTLVHCPHASRKEVADRVLLVDLMVFALECKEPASIVLITGDRDFTYAISVLRMKGHDVFVIFPPGRSAHSGLKHLATGLLAWTAVLQCEGSALDFEGSFSNTRRASTGSVPDRITHQSNPQASISTPECSLAQATTPSSSKPPKAVLPTPLSAVLARHKGASGKRPILMDTSNDAGRPSGVTDGGPVDPTDTQKSSSSGSSANPGNVVQNEPLGTAVIAPAETVAHRNLPPLTNASSTWAPPGLSLYIDYVGSSDSIMEIDAEPSCDATHGSSGSSLPRNQSKSNQCKKSAIVFSGLAGATIPSDASKKTFAVLIEVLLEERANGRMSTPCDTLEGLLRKAKPTIYQDAGVDELREYLGLAQCASIVFFSDILWENRQGWVSLRNPQDYDPNTPSCDRQAVVAALHATLEASRRRRRKGDAGLVGKNCVQHAVPGHTGARGGARFVQLIGIMQTLRSQGIKRIRRTRLYKPLQEPGSGNRMSRAEAMAYIDLARTSGVICGGKDTNDFVELHPEFC